MLRRVVRVTGFALLGLLGLLAALVLSVFTPPGRTAVCALLNAQLRKTFRGELHVARIETLRWDGPLRATGITLRDPQGRLVVTDGQLELTPVRDLVSGLWRGLRHKNGGGVMPAVSLRLATVRVLPAPDGAPSIAAALASRNPPPARTAPPPPGPPLAFRRIDVTVDRIESAVGGFAATATGLRVEGSATTEPLALVVRSSQVEFVSDRTPAITARATFDWRSHFEYPPPAFEARDVGTMAATLELAGRDLACSLAYRRTGTDTVARVRNCRAGREVIDQVAARPLGIDVLVPAVDAEQRGAGPWRVSARAAVNGQALSADGTVGGEDLVVDLGFAGLDLSRVREDLPASRIAGTAHVERHGARWALDTTRLRAVVSDKPVPPVRARVELAGRILRLEELSSEPLGLRARGEVDLDRPRERAVLDVQMHTGALERVPLVGPRARGALDLDAHAEARAGRVTARVSARARGLRAGQVRVGTADVRGTLALTPEGQGAPSSLDLAVRATGLVAPGGFGPLSLRLDAAGDPLRAVDGRVHVNGVAAAGAGGRAATSPSGTVVARGGGPVAPVALDGPFHVRVGRGTVEVSLPGAAVVLRGAAGTLSAHVALPRGGGAPAVRARVATSDGGEADVSIRGADVRGRFRRFSLAWTARALGTSMPLSGTLDGDLSLLTSRPGAPRGSLRWTDGRLPGLGAFDLEVTADHAAARESVFGATLAVRAPRTPGGAPPAVRAEVRAVPPSELGDAGGWLRGLRAARVDATGFSLEELPGVDGVAPRGTRLVGLVDALVVADRSEAGGPLAVTAGLDARDARLVRAAPRRVGGLETLPPALAGLLTRAGSSRVAAAGPALTVPMRLRAAVCAAVPPDGDVRRAPVSLDLALARQAGAAASPAPPRACAPPDGERPAALAPGDEALASARVALAGPWGAALQAAAREYRAAIGRSDARLDAVRPSAATRAVLSAASVRARVELGPIDAARWPLLPAARAVFPGIASPPIAGHGAARVVAAGSFYAPVVRLEAGATARDLAALVGRSEVAATVRARLAPSSPGAFIMEQADLEADARAALSVREGQGGAAVQGGIVTARASLAGPLARMIDRDETRPALARERIEVAARDLRLGWLRWARERGLDGRLSFTAHDGGSPDVLLVADATARGLSAGGGAIGSGALSARVERGAQGEWALRSCLETRASPATEACRVGAGDGVAPPGGLRADVAVPFVGNVTAGRPRLAGAVVGVVADRARLEPFSPLAEAAQLGRVGGALTARLAWRGAAPREVRGRVQLADGLLDLVALGVPARQVVLDLGLDGRRVELRTLALRMDRGTLEASGSADVETAPGASRLADVRLRAATRRLPVALEGNSYGQLTSHVEVAAGIGTDRATARVRVLDAQILLPSQARRELQPLAADPEIVVLGRTPAGGANGRGGGPTSGPVYPLDLELRSDAPVVVTRNDLYVAARLRLRARRDESGLALAGGVRLAMQRSWVEVLGKRFYFDRANVRFDGSTTVSPVLDVAAHHDAAGAGRINVFVTGRSTAPEIRFAAERYPDADQGEVLALLVLGRRETRGPGEQQNVAAQAESAAIGLVAGLGVGLLNASAREHLSFLPRLIVEPGSGGLSSGRYGVSATAMGGRLYVEGAFGSSPTYGGARNSVAGREGGASQEFQGLVEYSLSPRWSVSGQYGTSNRFGADVFWNPIP